ncbi:MAG: radical SAM protein [Fibrobacteria bacterium]
METPSPLQWEQSHHSREFERFIHAYPVVSRRSGGVSIGINLNVDKNCNFDCPYCQVDRTVPKTPQKIDPVRVREEAGLLLDTVDKSGVCRLERFAVLPDEAKRLTDIAVSGDGEPTMIPEFAAVCAELVALQASRPELDFKLVLITNSTMLDRKPVMDGIASLLSHKGEVWAKLDAGTEEWYQKINVSRISLDRIEANLVFLGRKHPYKIQSLFCGLGGTEPSADEIDAYLERLKRIKSSGSRILEVQLHTLARKPAQASCTPVEAGFLIALQARIETEAGLPARVYGSDT